jgi:hypothetical protein
MGWTLVTTAAGGQESRPNILERPSLSIPNSGDILDRQEFLSVAGSALSTNYGLELASDDAGSTADGFELRDEPFNHLGTYATYRYASRMSAEIAIECADGRSVEGPINGFVNTVDGVIDCSKKPPRSAKVASDVWRRCVAATG